MKTSFLKVGVLFVALTLAPSFLSSCIAQEKKHNEEKEGKEHSEGREGKGHDKDGKGHSEGQEGTGHDKDEKRGESEENGTQYDLSYKYNTTKYGVNLKLKYDKASNSFKGQVKNISSKIADRVRVEIHLSNGTELGPTTPIDLKAGQSKAVVLKATEKSFNGWSAHAEVGNREHSGSENGEGHNEREGKEEHRGGEKREHN